MYVQKIEAETGKQTTYEEMQENTIRCGLFLRKQGIGRGDVIVICTHNQLDAYIPCIATFYVGAIYNPWHHEVPLSKCISLSKFAILNAHKLFINFERMYFRNRTAFNESNQT